MLSRPSPARYCSISAMMDANLSGAAFAPRAPCLHDLRRALIVLHFSLNGGDVREQAGCADDVGLILAARPVAVFGDGLPDDVLDALLHGILQIPVVPETDEPFAGLEQTVGLGKGGGAIADIEGGPEGNEVVRPGRPAGVLARAFIPVHRGEVRRALRAQRPHGVIGLHGVHPAAETDERQGEVGDARADVAHQIVRLQSGDAENVLQSGRGIIRTLEVALGQRGVIPGCLHEILR